MSFVPMSDDELRRLSARPSCSLIGDLLANINYWRRQATEADIKVAPKLKEFKLNVATPVIEEEAA